MSSNSIKYCQCGEHSKNAIVMYMYAIQMSVYPNTYYAKSHNICECITDVHTILYDAVVIPEDIYDALVICIEFRLDDIAKHRFLQFAKRMIRSIQSGEDVYECPRAEMMHLVGYYPRMKRVCPEQFKSTPSRFSTFIVGCIVPFFFNSVSKDNIRMHVLVSELYYSWKRLVTRLAQSERKYAIKHLYPIISISDTYQSLCRDIQYEIDSTVDIHREFRYVLDYVILHVLGCGLSMRDVVPKVESFILNICMPPEYPEQEQLKERLSTSLLNFMEHQSAHTTPNM